MPIATNPETGDVLFLDESGQWKPAKKAINPDTREMLAFDGKAWQKVASHSKGVLDYVDDAVRAVAQGISFGYADEFAAKMDELTGRGGSYEKNLQRERARDAQIPAAISVPGQIAGGVMGAVAAAPVAGAAGAVTGLSRLPTAAKAVLGGAAAGGLYASGEAGSGLDNRLSAVPLGAAAGALAGGAAAGAGRVISHLRNPTGRALTEIERAATRDETNVARLAQASGRSIPADLGGENVKGLLERVAQTPGAGRTQVVPAITKRQEQQLDRMTSDLKELTGTRTSAVASVEQQMAARSAASDPLYKRAFEAGDKPIWNNELERLSAAPEVQQAMRMAVSGWQRSQIASGYGAMNPGALVDRGGMLTFLNGKVPVFPNIQFWDYTKSALDKIIQTKGTKPDGTMNRVGRDLTIITERLRNELTTAVPEYAQALKAWGGPSSYIKAIGDGKEFRKLSAEEVAMKLRSYGSDAEREAARTGFIFDIIGKMGSDPAKLADFTKYVRSPEMRKKIALMMPTREAAAKWEARLGFEVGSSELSGRVLRGSQTFRRQMEAKDAESLGVDLLMDMATGTHAMGLVNRVIRSTFGKARDTIRSRTDKEIAKLLLDPKALEKATIGRRHSLDVGK